MALQLEQRTPREKKETKTVRAKIDRGISLAFNLEAKTEAQKQFVYAWNNSHNIVAHGSPGTGKTFLSCYQSIMELKNNNLINKIVIIKLI